MESANPNRWLGLLALSISVLTVIMTGTSVNLALPAISHGFNTSIADLTWVIDAYTLALGALTLPGGTLGDIFGRRRVYLTGLGLFSLGAILASAAPNLGLLIAARVVMGTGAALVLPGTLSLISAMFQGRERATAIGLWGGMNGLALALGPIAGGFLVQYTDWRAVFWTNVPLAAIAFVMVPRYVPAIAPRSGKHRVDVPGAVTITGALALLIVALIEGSTWGWSSAATVGCFAGAVVLLTCFIAIESRTAEPMVPLTLFRSRTFDAANLSGAALMISVLSSFFFLSLFLQTILGYSGVRTGLAYLPLALFMAGLAPLAGRISFRFGLRLPIMTGLALAALGVFWMSRIAINGGYLSLVGGLILVGIGMGLASPPISNAAVSSAPSTMAGVASGMNAMSRQIGGSVGIALLTALFSSRFSDHLGRLLRHSSLPLPVQRQVLASASSGASNGATSAVPGRIQAIVHSAFTQGMADTLTIFSAIAALGLLAAVLIRPRELVRIQQVPASGEQVRS